MSFTQLDGGPAQLLLQDRGDARVAAASIVRVVGVLEDGRPEQLDPRALRVVEGGVEVERERRLALARDVVEQDQPRIG